MIFEILELFRPLECAVADRRDDLEFRRQGAQGHFEAHLIVARRRAAVRDHLGFERERHLRNRLRLQHPLRADAQRVYAAAPHIAHEQVFEHLLEIRGARIDQMMFNGAQLMRALGERARGGGIDAAGVDGHRDHRPLIGVLEPRHAE